MKLDQTENYKFIHHVLIRACDTAIHLLQKAKDFEKEKSLQESEILDARLAADMFDFKKQIQVFSDNVAGAVARGVGLEKPSMPDTEKTLEELVARVEKTKEFIKSIDPEKVGDLGLRKIKLPWMQEGMYFDAETYFGSFVLQNSMFHLVTAYDILRHMGVQIGKQDFIGTMDFKKEE